IVVMHDGIVEQIGTPLELYDHPVNLFVAGFIGSPAMNFIEGTLRRHDGAIWIEANDGTRLPGPADVNAGEGHRVIYGVRPEHFAIGNGGVAARVEVVEPTGADTQVFATMAGTQVCGVF